MSRRYTCALGTIIAVLGLLSPAVAKQRTITERIMEVRQLTTAGQYQRADSVGTALVADLRKLSDVPSGEFVDALTALQDARYGNGKAAAPETVKLAEEAVAVTESDPNHDPLLLAKRVGNLGRAYDQAGRKKEAVPQFERAIRMFDDADKGNEPTLAGILIGQGNCLNDLGRFADAQASFGRSLKILRSVSPLDSLNVGRNLNGLAISSVYLGDYKRSVDLFFDALQYYTTALGPSHPRTAMVRDNCGSIAQLLGDYRRARVMHERSLADLERTLSANHPLVAQACENLGALLLQMGEYVDAQRLLDRAVQIYVTVRGPEDVDVAGPLLNRGKTKDLLGDTQGAGEDLSRALAIRRAKLPASHPEVAQALTALAQHEAEGGDAAGAQRHIDEALEVFAHEPSPEHVGSVEVNRTSAGLAMRRGDWRGAEDALSRALTIAQKELPQDHPDVAAIKVSLTVARSRGGLFAGSLDTLTSALEAEERVLGPNHPQISETLEYRSLEFHRVGQISAAFEDAARADSIRRWNAEVTTRSLPERLALRCAAVQNRGIGLMLEIAAGNGSHAQQTRAWDAVIHSRGLVLEEIAARHRKITGSDDPEITALNDSLTSARERLAHLTLSVEEFDTYRQRVFEATRERDRIEAQLANRVASVRAERERRAIGYDQVSRALPRNAALVAYARSRAEGEEPTSADEAFAFVLQNGKVDLVRLGSVSKLTARVEKWREVVGKDPPPGSNGLAEETECRRAGAALRTAIWDPLRPLLVHAKRVFIVPDGSLHLINFAALPVGQDRYLIDQLSLIQMLGTERDLVADDHDDVHGRGLLAMGDIDYSVSGSGSGRSAYRGSAPSCGTFSTFNFAPLAQTAGEINDVVKAWREAPVTRKELIDSLSGSRASEEAFKAEAPGKRVIHLATHGFFLAPECAGRNSPSSGPDLPLIAGDSPLVLSGLALAGANTRSRSASNGEDGILTAEEVGAMDLAGVECVVLSACETGLGVVQAGEGVFGLRRAFAVAGAQDVVISLWRVDDSATRAWMRELYRARARGLLAGEAAQAASKAHLEERRKLHRNTHPKIWAAFVATGR